MINSVKQTRMVFPPFVKINAPIADQPSRRRSLMVSLSLSSFTALIGAFSALAVVSFGPSTWVPAALAQSYPTLSAGSSGETVSQLQATLKLLGFYTGEVNGAYDQPTATAVTQFQAAAGILADGVAGPTTWQKLLPSPSDVTATSQSAPVTAAVGAPTLPAPVGAATPPAEPQAPLGPPVLRAEAEGPAVAQLQRELQTLGYYSGDIDGGFGEQTKVAVEEFQADQQLFVDGVVGGATWDALSRALDRL
ncbi:MAG: peptidoglycan-binding protein [Phormidesmis sp.]